MAIFHFQKHRNTISKELFESVYRDYYTRLYYYSFQFVEDSELSKDIVNDVFEKLWTQRDELRTETLSTYLYTLVRNKCLDYLRHEKVEERYADLYETVTSDDQEDMDVYEERMQRIERILADLTEPTKSIFMACYFRNKKYAEVAEDFHMSTNGIKKHIMKVLRLIRKEFNL